MVHAEYLAHLPEMTSFMCVVTNAGSHLDHSMTLLEEGKRTRAYICRSTAIEDWCTVMCPIF